MNSGVTYASLPSAFKFIFFLSADVNLSNLNVLTWRENYAGSSGLPSVKLPSDLLNSRISDGAMVRQESIKPSYIVVDRTELSLHGNLEILKMLNLFMLLNIL